MSGADLERVRSDLSTVRNALGLDLVWSITDVWFCGATSAAAGLYALLSWPGLPLTIPSLAAAAPLLVTLAAYLIYMAVKWRSLPPREESRRSEYRSTLVALAVAVPAAALYLLWGRHAGMTGIQLRGSLLAVMGIAFLIIGIAQPPQRYPRSYFIVGSLPLMAFGAALPLAAPAYNASLIGLLGLVELGMATGIVHRQVARSARSLEGNGHAAD